MKRIVVVGMVVIVGRSACVKRIVGCVDLGKYSDVRHPEEQAAPVQVGRSCGTT